MCCFANIHAAIALNHGRGGPHKFGWQNTSDHEALKRAFLCEKAKEKHKHSRKAKEQLMRVEHPYKHSM